jgi:hypothetical protein
MFNKICVKDEYLIKVSFLKYSGLLDCLFSSGVYRLEVSLPEVIRNRGPVIP